jgi:DNA-binding response OmpR family regulator
MGVRHRILLLEDEPLLRGMLGMALGAQGFDLLSGSSAEVGETLLRVVGWQWPELVISDANLSRQPEVLLGYAFHARWRARYPVPPFLFMHTDMRFTAFPRHADCRVCHILKPFAPGDLLLLVRAILAK